MTGRWEVGDEGSPVSSSLMNPGALSLANAALPWQFWPLGTRRQRPAVRRADGPVRPMRGQRRTRSPVPMTLARSQASTECQIGAHRPARPQIAMPPARRPRRRKLACAGSRLCPGRRTPHEPRPRGQGLSNGFTTALRGSCTTVRQWYLSPVPPEPRGL